MNKTLRLKRLYSLGDYRNIEFGDEITEIPEHISNNEKAMKLLRYLQLVDTEYAFNNYMLLKEKTHNLTIEDALAFMEEERTQTFKDLLASFQGE